MLIVARLFGNSVFLHLTSVRYISELEIQVVLFVQLRVELVSRIIPQVEHDEPVPAQLVQRRIAVTRRDVVKLVEKRVFLCVEIFIIPTHGAVRGIDRRVAHAAVTSCAGLQGHANVFVVAAPQLLAVFHPPATAHISLEVVVVGGPSSRVLEAAVLAVARLVVTVARLGAHCRCRSLALQAVVGQGLDLYAMSGQRQRSRKEHSSHAAIAKSDALILVESFSTVRLRIDQHLRD
mmetsp:Transcript_22931/g.47583  ORF Transcript_22931/g.47583 Transcript_22931/m.47583 type:complete len:235 (+) Transcript_22931:1195-1899(+)